MTGSRPGRLHVGTSGWAYRSWQGGYYPEGLARSAELGYLARRLTSTEVNASFYRLQSPTTYRRWWEQTPAEHTFAVKGSRYVTHLKRLRDPAPHLQRLAESGIAELGDKLRVLLWQLPASLSFDPSLVADFVAALRAGPLSGWRHAIEPRHRSFATDEAAAVLAAGDVATVWSDGAGAWPVIDQDTSDLRYVRLHGHSVLYASRYSTSSLATWALRCRRWLDGGQEVHVYFDNDQRGHAPYDAERLLAALRGMPVGQRGTPSP